MKKTNMIIIVLAVIAVILGLLAFQNRKANILQQSAETQESITQEEGVVSGETIVSSASESATPQPTLTTTATSEPKYVFFYGDTCPYCHDVIVWLEENDIESQLNIVRKEVYNNKSNSQQLALAAQACVDNPASGGVPFLFTPDKECIVGSTPIIEYLTEKLGL